MPRRSKAERNEELANQNAERDLRHLTRAELLELLLDMSEELEKTKAELEALKAENADRRIRLSEAGNIAEAALSLSGIFEAAQKAADDYLDGVRALASLNLTNRDEIEATLRARLPEEEGNYAALSAGNGMPDGFTADMGQEISHE